MLGFRDLVGYGSHFSRRGWLMRVRAILVCLMVIFLSACASSGQEITQQQIDQIVKGQTTKPELLSLLGRPQSVMSNSDGTEILTWAYAHVGFMGSNVKSTGLSVVIGQDGKVASYSTTQYGQPSVRYGY